MKEKKDLNVKFLSILSRVKLHQLCAVLIVGNALYFSYSTYFHHETSSKTLVVHHDQNDNIQLLK